MGVGLELVTTYASQKLDVIDASIIVVAERLGLSEIATMNSRDFFTVRRALGVALRVTETPDPLRSKSMGFRGGQLGAQQTGTEVLEPGDVPRGEEPRRSRPERHVPGQLGTEQQAANIERRFIGGGHEHDVSAHYVADDAG